MSAIEEAVARFTDKRLAMDLRHLATNVRWCDKAQREATLREAARRLDNGG